MSNFSIPAGLVCLAVVVLTGGCATDEEQTYEVTGRVTYQGRPVDDAVINFLKPNGRPVGGPLREDGRYDVRLRPGEYPVIVNAGPTLPKGWKEGERLPPQSQRIPRKYSQPQSSGLSAQVTPQSSPIVINYDLE